MALAQVVVRCKTSYTGLFSFLAIPLLMGDIMITFMSMIDINGELGTSVFSNLLCSVNIMITTAATTTVTTAAPNNNNNNNNNGGGSGSASGTGNNNNNNNPRSLYSSEWDLGRLGNLGSLGPPQRAKRGDGWQALQQVKAR